MFYIISPISLEELKRYKFTKSSRHNWIKFLSSDTGREFLDIAPIRIMKVKNMEQALFMASTDISFFSMAYNCPLYISFLSNKIFKEDFHFKIKNHLNMGKVQKILETNKKEAEKAKINAKSTYYCSDDNVISEELRKITINAQSSNIKIYLTKEKGFELIVENLKP